METQHNQVRKVKATSTFFTKIKKSCEKGILPYVHVEKILFVKFFRISQKSFLSGNAALWTVYEKFEIMDLF